jgi:type II restriction/modification system DNA methylase subunit YeeA
MDAILAFDQAGRPIEPTWPEADVVIGNPPFLGDKKMRAELGDEYVEQIRKLYEGRVPGGADLVTYWFERSRALIERREVQRAGLLATQAIRGGANRKILERIKQTGDIFMAWADRKWYQEGAAVQVSMVGFDSGREAECFLNGNQVTSINPNLTATTNLTSALPLQENTSLSSLGMMKAGAFDIDAEVAVQLIAAPLNPNGRPNTDVVRPRIGGRDITGRSQGEWIIDFGVDLPEDEAALYEKPFEYVRTHVKPIRDQSTERRLREHWWIFSRPRPALRKWLKPIPRCIVTPEVAKHRVFAWLPTTTLPDHQLIVFAREDDYFFGVLHSRVHELWARAMGTQLREAESGFRYTPTTTFETFPFPWPPGREPQGDPRIAAIAAAAKRLVELRDTWLNPPGASEAELKKRTLTNLYNERPTWLHMAHTKLDRAVLDAYGWPHDLGDEEILERLLALNLERAARQGGAVSSKAAEDDQE